jgi:aspartate 1-decarboxylase
MRWVLRSKIHKAVVTEANLAYVGSITIDQSLVEKAGFMIGERVLITSNDSGARLETYVILGERGSGNICMNGAAAHLIKPGEEIIIMGFELTDRPISPQVILVDRQNRFVRHLTEQHSQAPDPVEMKLS